MKESKAALCYCIGRCQPRIINDCTGIIRSVDTEKEEKNSAVDFDKV